MTVGKSEWSVRARVASMIVVTLCVGALSTQGCSERSSSTTGSQTKRLVLGQIVTELTALDRRGKRVKLDVSLDDIVKGRVAASRALAVMDSETAVADRRRAARLRVDARLIPDGFSGKLHAFVEARATQTGTIPLTANLDATLEETPDAERLPQDVYAKHLERAVSDALKAIDEQAELLFSGNETLIKALSNDERDIRMAAIRTLGERRAAEGVEPLCDVLRREKNEVGQAAIGALVAIKNEKAVPCIIQWAGADDRRLILSVDPLASIGGTEAQAFLEMIASGHEDHRIKMAAEEALRRLEASTKSPSESER